MSKRTQRYLRELRCRREIRVLARWDNSLAASLWRRYLASGWIRPPRVIVSVTLTGACDDDARLSQAMRDAASRIPRRGLI
jgi:hypothetical protein